MRKDVTENTDHGVGTYGDSPLPVEDEDLSDGTESGEHTTIGIDQVLGDDLAAEDIAEMAESLRNTSNGYNRAAGFVAVGENQNSDNPEWIAARNLGVSSGSQLIEGWFEGLDTVIMYDGEMTDLGSRYAEQISEVSEEVEEISRKAGRPVEDGLEMIGEFYDSLTSESTVRVLNRLGKDESEVDVSDISRATGQDYEDIEESIESLEQAGVVESTGEDSYRVTVVGDVLYSGLIEDTYHRQSELRDRFGDLETAELEDEI